MLNGTELAANDESRMWRSREQRLSWREAAADGDETIAGRWIERAGECSLDAQFAQRLGAGFMIRGRERKWIHRQVCRDFLPPQILARKKRGFAVNVVDGWFNSSVEGKLPEMLRDENSLMYQFLNPEAVRGLLEAHRSGRADNHKVLFSLAMVEQWLLMMMI